jgi:hypothetical protein
MAARHRSNCIVQYGITRGFPVFLFAAVLYFEPLDEVFFVEYAARFAAAVSS